VLWAESWACIHKVSGCLVEKYRSATAESIRCQFNIKNSGLEPSVMYYELIRRQMSIVHSRYIVSPSSRTGIDPFAQKDGIVPSWVGLHLDKKDVLLKTEKHDISIFGER
jgi:hypothetical protein